MVLIIPWIYKSFSFDIDNEILNSILEKEIIFSPNSLFNHSFLLLLHCEIYVPSLGTCIPSFGTYVSGLGT